MDDLYHLYQSLSGNPIAMSLIIAPLLSGISFILVKYLPGKIYNTIVSFFSVHVEMYQAIDQVPFETGEFLLKKYTFWSPFTKFVLRKPGFANESVLSVGINTNFYGIIDGVFCRVTRFHDPNEQMHHTFILVFQFFTRNKKKIDAILAKAAIERKTTVLEDKLYLYLTAEWGHAWTLSIKECTHTVPRTAQQTMALDRILAAIANPKMKKLGILLYGIGGCGKTNLVYQIAERTKYRIYFLPLATQTSNSFLDVFGKIITPSIILLEDIDCVAVTHDRDSENEQNQNPSDKLNLSMILNVLDGILSNDNQIVIATTNHKEKLDPALIRKGRFDITIELQPMTIDEVAAYIADVYHELPETILAILQGYTTYRTDMWRLPISAVAAACKESLTYREAIDTILIDHYPDIHAQCIQQ